MVTRVRTATVLRPRIRYESACAQGGREFGASIYVVHVNPSPLTQGTSITGPAIDSTLLKSIASLSAVTVTVSYATCAH